MGMETPSGVCINCKKILKNVSDELCDKCKNNITRFMNTIYIKCSHCGMSVEIDSQERKSFRIEKGEDFVSLSYICKKCATVCLLPFEFKGLNEETLEELIEKMDD